LTNLRSDSLVNGCREGHVTRAEMNLHVAVDELAPGSAVTSALLTAV
jgi:hypothetical protein